MLKHRDPQDHGMHAFLSFLAVSAVAMVVPGPDTFVVLRTSLADGPRVAAQHDASDG